MKQNTYTEMKSLIVLSKQILMTHILWKRGMKHMKLILPFHHDKPNPKPEILFIGQK